MLVDLPPSCPEVVVPMVKKDVFNGNEDALLCVLSWGGIDLADLYVETPGRFLRRFHEMAVCMYVCMYVCIFV